MSSGYCPNQAWVITQESLEKLMPKAWHNLQEALENIGLSVDDFCRKCQYDNQNDEAEKVWQEFVEEFESKTRVEGDCLSLFPRYHASDNGDRYDTEEVDRGFFIVSGVTKLTPAGEKFEEFLIDALWTEYG